MRLVLSGEKLLIVVNTYYLTSQAILFKCLAASTYYKYVIVLRAIQVFAKEQGAQFEITLPGCALGVYSLEWCKHSMKPVGWNLRTHR